MKYDMGMIFQSLQISKYKVKWFLPFPGILKVTGILKEFKNVLDFFLISIFKNFIVIYKKDN